jgi:lysophospholipase L1-like esterase
MVVDNTAIIPVPKLEEDSYDWYARHAEVLRIKGQIDPENVMIGDSITHFWGGEPDNPIKHGENSWPETFGDIPVLNMGFGWDRTQNVLWRLENGEFDWLHPKSIVLNIGTNNLTGTENARENTPAEICEGIVTICYKLYSMSPESRIIVMGIFPRGEFSDDPFRKSISAVNTLLAENFMAIPSVTVLDIGESFLQADGSLSPEIMFDFVHLTPAGYAIWAKALVDVGVISR